MASLRGNMLGEERRIPANFDELLGNIENYTKANATRIQSMEDRVGAKISKSIYEGVSLAKSRSAQFQLIRDGIEYGTELFKSVAEPISKETIMSIARRAPTKFLDDTYVTLASLSVAFSASNARASFDVNTPNEHGNEYGLVMQFKEDEVEATFQLMAIAKVINRLENMGRWIGKGGSLHKQEDRLVVRTSDAIQSAVSHYERRRPRAAFFDTGGFFAPEPDIQNWSEFRMPMLAQFKTARMIEAPINSQRWLYFDKWPIIKDAGGLARILRGYDEALKETWEVGYDTILHFLTAIAVNCNDTIPRFASIDDKLGLDQGSSRAEFEHKLSFVFGLSRKGFIRMPRDALIRNVGRVRSIFAPDQEQGEKLASDFINAFLDRPSTGGEARHWSQEASQFIHSSTGNYIYVDLVLMGDFLSVVIESAKKWYSSQHGDRFVLALKQWLDREAPGAVVSCQTPVKLMSGANSDIDLLLRTSRGPLVVECKAYAKNAEFLLGAPAAVSKRRARIKSAVEQSKKIGNAYARLVSAGETTFQRHAVVTPIVCSPTVEFLSPIDEYGMLTDLIPRVVTPEELLDLLT